jgi:hypothetical protein
MNQLPADLQTMLDRQSIIERVQSWGFYRDGKQWEKLRDLYTADGRMTTTWTIASADEFVNHCKAMAGRGGGRKAMHSIGITKVDLNGDRAIAETRMTLLVRGVLDGVEVDITNYGGTYDFFLRCADGIWRIKERVPMYEKDRLDPVDPSATVKIDPARLATFPYGYRYLAYLQSSEGATITPDLPGNNSESQQKVFRRGAQWLAGQ